MPLKPLFRTAGDTATEKTRRSFSRKAIYGALDGL